MSGFRIFAQIKKVDEARREVWGRAVQEMPDRSGEIFDYESSKPYFKAWSDSFVEATGGKSMGNIRAMHGKISAGKAIALDFNDPEKAIDIGTKIVDDNEWQKVMEGCYTGFSIGGSYVEGSKKAEKSADGKELTRYTADPAEISLVDLPCIPGAQFFDIVKADGTLTKIDFRLPAPAATDAGSAPASADSAGAPSTDTGAGQEPVAKTIDVKASPEEIAATEEIAKLLNDGTIKAADLLSIVKRDFTDKERKHAADEGAAMKDGSFPIETVEDLHNAIQSIGRAKDESAAKRHIIDRAKAIGAEKELPDEWIDKGTTEGKLTKGMWDVQSFASILQSIASIASGAQYDLESEGDGSPIPKQLRQWVADGVSIFKDMAAEEADELMTSLNTTAGVSYVDGVEMPLEAAARVRDLRKQLDDPALTWDTVQKLAKEYDEPAGDDFAKRVLAKAGARHSKADMDRIQKAHDHLQELGAQCGTTGNGKAAGAEDLTKDSTIADLQKQLADVTGRLAAIEKQPVPARVILRAVSKAQDNGGKDGDTVAAEQLEQFLVKDANGEVNLAASMTKYLLSRPGEPVDPRLRAAP